MGGLSELEFKTMYRRASTESLLSDFFVPCLNEAVTYSRIAGYFSASVLVAAAHGFTQFSSREGAKYRLIVGACLIPDEVDLIFGDNESIQAAAEKTITRDIQGMADSIGGNARDRLRNLSYLIEKGILEMRVAVRIDSRGRYLPHAEAEFHEKGGVFSDGNSRVGFFGSVNESNRGWVRNQESILVFSDQQGHRDSEILDDMEREFEKFWICNGINPDLEVAVYDLPSDSAKSLIEAFPPLEPRESQIIIDDEVEEPEEEPEDDRWRHQEEAVDWFCEGQASGIGVFEMATGSGKTWTAMKCMRKLLEISMIDRVIIAVPKTLLGQWRGELTSFLRLKRNGGVISTLKEYSGEKKEHLEFKRAGHGSFLLVSHTMLLELLNISKHWNPNVLANTFCVVDEMHNVGADRFRPDEGDEDIVDLEQAESSFKLFGCRLGLSATPWSHFDEENHRNQFLVRNFTRFNLEGNHLFEYEDWRLKLREEGHVFHFGLGDGIQRGILAEFEYITLEYIPSAEEIVRYRKLVRGAFAVDERGRSNPLGAIRAAAVFKGSREKIPVFKKWLEENPQLDRTLIFVEDTAFGNEIMADLNSMGYSNFTKYFMGDDEWNLKSFANGTTNFLVSCHRISEGIDIQSVSQIILFSSATTQLETIQRIGRALRKGDAPKRSIIVDFLYDELDSDQKRSEWLTELAQERNPP